MTERNIYRKPEDKVLLRTADVYQTEMVDDVSSYSDRLLSLIADFKNSGMPEGANAQSMVGKSKRGEVACRLFARIDPGTGIIEAAGFKARGCLAMTACASAACLLIEGKPIEDAIALTSDEISEFVDGVPADKIHALYFAECAVRALVGDFLLNDGASLQELEEALPCDEDSVSCVMAEHCSYRQSLREKRMDEQERKRDILTHNACAEVMDLVRANTARKRLTKPADWAELKPDHLMPKEFDKLVIALATDVTDHLSPEDADSRKAQRKPSRFANRGVGIPRMSQHDADDSADDGVDATDAVPEHAHASVLDSIEHVYDYSRETIPAAGEEEMDLVPPEGYELVQVDGIWGLVPTDAPHELKERPLDADGIKAIRGASTPYLYDGNRMTSTFAKWAFLAEEDDPLTTFAFCVREESRTYPRPMAEKSFANAPFNMDAATVETIWEEASASEDHADLHRITASNGDVYFYSSSHLTDTHAQSLAEWESVDRLYNV